MKIGEFAELTGLSVHTLRFYDQLGLLVPRRIDNGHRDYDENDLEWIGFIERLKSAGMPLGDIRTYALLRSQGNETIPVRISLLAEHREHVEAEITVLQSHLALLDAKIAIYNAMESAKQN